MKSLSSLVALAVLILVAGCHDPKGPPATQQALTAPAVAAEIIIDDADPTFRSEGAWTSAVGGKDYKDEVVWAEGSATASAKATWTPVIKVAGNYDVYEWHGEDPNGDHATNAPFTIKYDGGSTTINVNLRENPGKWNKLGTFKFAAGTGGNVMLTNKANGNVIADAMRFVPQK